MIPKLRVWDIKNKVMCWINNINFEKQEAWIEADHGDHETRHTITRSFDEIVFMQSTGLFDKTGTEIFEGDRVIGGGVSAQDGFTIVNDMATTVHFDGGVFMAGQISLRSLNRDCEIVGNICEGQKK